MRAGSVDEAIALQNSTQFGSTGGIASLDEREVAGWERHVQVGNAYVNRQITGAIVRRQPFGGWKRSSIGSGAKAGGPIYVASFGWWWREPWNFDLAVELDVACLAAGSFVRGIDDSGMAAERNRLRLRPLGRAVLRLGTVPDTQALELSLRVASQLEVHIELSAPPEVCEQLARPSREESDEELLRRMRVERPDRVRLAGCVPDLRLALLDAGCEVDIEPLVALGPYEMSRWSHEQAISTTQHRHGNVMRSTA